MEVNSIMSDNIGVKRGNRLMSVRQTFCEFPRISCYYPLLPATSYRGLPPLHRNPRKYPFFALRTFPNNNVKLTNNSQVNNKHWTEKVHNNSREKNFYRQKSVGERGGVKFSTPLSDEIKANFKSLK